MTTHARPAQIVPEAIHSAALIIAFSELSLDGDRTDLSGILRALDGAGLRFSERELAVVIERARQERDAAHAARVLRQQMEVSHGAV